MATNPGQINSPFALEIPQTAPESFTEPQVVAAVNMFLTQQAQMLAGLLGLLQANSPDKATWSSITPNSSIIDWHLTRFYKKCDVALPYGCLVNVSTTGVRKADASLQIPAHGFVLAAYNLGDTAECFEGVGIITNVTGLTQGQSLYLGNAGVLTSVVPIPTTFGQFVGYGITNNIVRIRLGEGRTF